MRAKQCCLYAVVVASLLGRVGQGWADEEKIQWPSEPGLDLESMARELEDLAWEHWRAPQGAVYCFVMRDAMDRVRQADIAADAPDPDKLEPNDLAYVKETLEVREKDGMPQYLLQGIPLEDVEAFEDSAAASGTLLSALTFRYLATREPAARERAGELFDALYKIYELGLAEQPGWIPKPYGWQCTQQSSMDNQCGYYQGIIRYHAIAPEEDRRRARQVLADMLDYWRRNEYHMHVTYFGIDVDYGSDRFYPGHWPLFFLPLADAVAELSNDPADRATYDDLVSRLDIEAGADPEYMRTKVRCMHRWSYEYGALLEQDAEPRDLWLKGLAYQRAAYEPSGRGMERTLLFYWWLNPKNDEDRAWVADNLRGSTLERFLYHWPDSVAMPATRAFRERAIYTIGPAKWLETYWRGRLGGMW